MTNDVRLPKPFGAVIDRSNTIEFTFEGKTYSGYSGDTIASALIASGQWLIGRSFKYHRPRSIFSPNGADANLFVTVDGVPNQPAESVQISDGMQVLAQNYKGSLTRDRWKLPAVISRFMPVGFYYWAFFRPFGVWRFWERFIRARAGLGRIDPNHKWMTRDKKYDWADVVVVGAGPTGRAAAIAAADSSADVLLIDRAANLGGPVAASVRCNLEMTVHGLYADGWIAASKGGHLYKIRARKIVLATGAIEQNALFRNNDLPGIMLGDTALELIQDYGVKPGIKAIVITNNEDGYQVATALLAAGHEQITLVDTRSGSSPDGATAGLPNVTVHRGHEPVFAIGKKHVSGLTIRPVSGGKMTQIRCDLICLCGGRVPDAALWCHAGGKVEYHSDKKHWRLADEPIGVRAAGSMRGLLTEDESVRDGTNAGQHVAHELGFSSCDAKPSIELSGTAGPEPIIVPNSKGHEFVDFDEDLTIKDIQNSHAQGFDHPQLLKRYSTLGMGPSQGRHAQLASAELIARMDPEGGSTVGTTTFRPPVHGISFAALAGDALHPERVTPIDGWHRQAGAKMMVAGPWWRPAYYPSDTFSEPQMIALSEARHVRNKVGIIDVSTLGKIELRGPDAARFMELFYTFRYAKQPVGRSRYVLATDETGSIIDDGVACRLSDTHFYVSTTTGASDQIYRSMLWWNIQLRLDLDISNVTGAYAAINLAGPQSREVLASLTEIDISANALPYLGVSTGLVAGVTARITRIGFVGELGFEIHIPSGYGLHLWQSLIEAGAEKNIRPFGVEAQRLLRLEKGHIIVGQDTDGLTHPAEVGMAWAVADKSDFVGKRSIDILQNKEPERSLVGYRLPLDVLLPEEGNLVFCGDDMVGRVTSTGLDCQTGAPLGLAFVSPHMRQAGTAFDIKLDNGQRLRAVVSALPFYDPDNLRQGAKS